jgi:hypothetical protein
MNPRVISVIYKSDFQLELTFDNNEKKFFSLLPYLNYNIYKPLANTDFARTARAKYGTVIWGDDESIDFDPDTLWLESYSI